MRKFISYFPENNDKMRFEVNNMQTIDLQTTEDKFLISIDKDSIDK